jgi:oxalate decarboxylase/phosphoglucose isomerase-like protein (cupin superfamily)
LLKREDVSIIEERVPAGGAETMHYHEKARQFFYVLDGEGVMGTDVHFLVISVPSTRGDRLEQ